MESRIKELEDLLYVILKDVGIDKATYHEILKKPGETDRAAADIFMELHEAITVPLFNEVNNWDDVVALYTLFVRNKLPSVPTHFAPLNLDTRSLIDKLERIIKRGAITVDSQPGTCDNLERQRAYVKFIVNLDKTSFGKWKSALSKRNDILWEITTPQGNVGNIRETIASWNMVDYLEGPDRRFRTTRPIEDNDYVRRVSDDPDIVGRFVPLTLGRYQGDNAILSVDTQFPLEHPSTMDDWEIIVESSPYMQEVDAAVIAIYRDNFCKMDILDILDELLDDVTGNCGGKRKKSKRSKSRRGRSNKKKTKSRSKKTRSRH